MRFLPASCFWTGVLDRSFEKWNSSYKTDQAKNSLLFLLLIWVVTKMLLFVLYIPEQFCGIKKIKNKKSQMKCYEELTTNFFLKLKLTKTVFAYLRPCCIPKCLRCYQRPAWRNYETNYRGGFKQLGLKIRENVAQFSAKLFSVQYFQLNCSVYNIFS